MNHAATITVSFAAVGFHCWPGAPERRAYLRYRHRHLFTVKVSTTVAHDDREIEFHDLQDYARSLWPDDGELGFRSCEAIAREIATQMTAHYGRSFLVEVCEDEEVCAAVV